MDRMECSCVACTSGWAEKGSSQEDAKNLGTKIGASDIPFALVSRVGRDESRAKALIIDKKKASLSKEGHSRVRKYT